MAINYEKVGWDTTKFVGPTNLNQMDDGIKAACDEVDALNTAMGSADISGVGDGTVKGAIKEVNNNLNDATNKLNVVGGVSVTTVTLDVDAKANQENEYTLLENLASGTYIISAVTHIDNSPIPTGKRLFAAIASRAYIAATSICNDDLSWQWNQTIFFKGVGCVIRILPEFDFKCKINMSIYLMRIK